MWEKMNEIVVIGSLNTDMVTKVRDRPEIGETIMGETFFTSPGGKGANQAYAAAALGGNVRMIGRVGGDHFGQELIDQLKKVNVKTDSIIVDSTDTSGKANIIIDQNGDNSIIVIPGANDNLSVEDIRQQSKYLLQAKLIVIQLEIPIETVKEAIKIAASNHIPVLMDPSPVPKLGISDELISKTTYIAPNITELSHLTGRTITDYKSVVLSSEKLLNKGVKCVFAKLGNQGAVVSTNKGVFHVPGYNVNAVDTTAAGDTFIGALAATIIRDLPINECVKIANAAAALTVTRYGAQNAMPTLEETNQFISNFTTGGISI